LLNPFLLLRLLLLLLLLQPVRLLGTGGFGEVYLCRWHSCDVAVKCLNPNLLVPDGGMGSISKVRFNSHFDLVCFVEH
jgi:serine/threonine protein kinase